jgi:hypothetical protein
MSWDRSVNKVPAYELNDHGRNTDTSTRLLVTVERLWELYLFINNDGFHIRTNHELLVLRYFDIGRYIPLATTGFIGSVRFQVLTAASMSLLGCCVVLSGRRLPTFQRLLLPPSPGVCVCVFAKVTQYHQHDVAFTSISP